MNKQIDIFEIDKAVLSEVEKFLKDTAMSASEFGEAFMNDRSFVFSLRKGDRSVTGKRIKKLMQDMSEYESQNPPLEDAS